jgi:hypothetical protein
MHNRTRRCIRALCTMFETFWSHEPQPSFMARSSRAQARKNNKFPRKSKRPSCVHGHYQLHQTNQVLLHLECSSGQEKWLEIFCQARRGWLAFQLTVLNPINWGPIAPTQSRLHRYFRRTAVLSTNPLKPCASPRRNGIPKLENRLAGLTFLGSFFGHAGLKESNDI